MIRSLLLWALPPWLFCGCRWYRWLRGGHWELWYVDNVHAELWYDVPACSRESGSRPTAICRGRPTCEDWP